MEQLTPVSIRFLSPPHLSATCPHPPAPAQSCHGGMCERGEGRKGSCPGGQLHTGARQQNVRLSNCDLEQPSFPALDGSLLHAGRSIPEENARGLVRRVSSMVYLHINEWIPLTSDIIWRQDITPVSPRLCSCVPSLEMPLCPAHGKSQCLPPASPLRSVPPASTASTRWPSMSVSQGQELCVALLLTPP